MPINQASYAYAERFPDLCDTFTWLLSTDGQGWPHSSWEISLSGANGDALKVLPTIWLHLGNQ